MITLTDNQETKVGAGTYAIKTTGACDLLWDIGDGLFFQAIEGASFSGATTAQINLPACSVKLTGASTLSLLLMNS